MLTSIKVDPASLFREVVGYNLRLARAHVPVQVWIPPCRYCYGINHEYQRTHEEFESDLEQHLKRHKKILPKPIFDPKGGSDYDDSLPPNPQCPNCKGNGDTDKPVVKFKDTRLFSPEERELFNGAKLTRCGIEMFWKEQTQARAFLADLALRMAEYHKPEDPIDINAMSVTQLRQLLDFAKDQGFDVDLGEEEDEN